LKNIEVLNPKIGILLSTYNGEKYLMEQLSSILNQSYINWKIYASDDQSQDTTLSILNEFQDKIGKELITIITGPNSGLTNNFINLVRKFNSECDYFAFCDQDDIWDKDKLRISIDAISSYRELIPTLYCSATKYISANGKYLQNSYIFKNNPSFKNALVQSIAGGNTMLFNKTAANLLAKTPVNQRLISHDWWLYILITAHDGYVYYDTIPQINYRQHSRALVGENRSIRSMILRIKKLLNGRFKEWNDENLRLLMLIYSELPFKNKTTLINFSNLKSKKISVRLIAFFISGIRRQTLLGNIALFIAIIIRKI
jgi:glycosyltransferase involved in cell wall biosynthesis